ncbi:MAG: glutathione S-transferase N-terminal domain-containing protein, partial [Actinomycetota bacterium]|nr:glutathione S-transferase N-terminal domain-containing protein [Actinomycetota bacterium]
MDATLYVVPASHPCATVERALELKGIGYRRVDLVPGLHKLAQRRRFGAATVPGLELGGERLIGSRRIVRRLDELVAEPELYPRDAHLRVQVERAEEWGDEVLQSFVRRLSWALLRRAPGAMDSYTAGAQLPIPPRIAALASAPVAALSARLNGASDPNVRADLINLPRHLDRVDRWIDAGVLGGQQPNAADLQIAASLRLALTFGDLVPAIDPRPAGRLARAQFPEYPGHVPAGTLPSAW